MVKEKFKQSLRQGILRRPAKFMFDSAVSLELGWERILDTLRPVSRAALTADFDSQLTAMVKTFERPAVLRRLVASVRRRYPGLPVIVVDDSRQPLSISGVKTITLPFDSGVSAGRNAGLAQVETSYVLILDDDFIFYRHTDLYRALAVMEANPQIDILGGEVVYLPFYNTWDYGTTTIFGTDAQPTLPPGSEIAGLPVLDKVPNFYIARTERLRLVGWDAQIKRLDHADFFARARGVLTSVYDSRLKCLHAQTPFDLAYMSYRNDLQRDLEVLRGRYSRSPSGAA